MTAVDLVIAFVIDETLSPTVLLLSDLLIILEHVGKQLTAQDAGGRVFSRWTA